MKQRLFASVMVCLGLVGTAGCDKPSEASCKKAVANIRELFGTARMSVDTVADSAWIRACRATAKHSSVKCAIEAQSLDQLKACGLLKGKQLEELEAVERELKALQPPMPTAIDAGPPPSMDAAPTTDDAGAAAGSGSGSAAGSGSGSAAGSGSAPAAAPATGSAAAPAPAAPTP